ncbi:hypothetical protein Poli38472_005899 [Pythium oligandrum]|uniref:SAC3/GANP/THP3 conserved domain-containing protein n=1 Tax=Pythium oligandrum TaxID=41045 RepID=A0A8K1FMN4_PYTOL|nr:hypothetical protein Poli38472_005899 [Pythium oligandrum]|eukprot:TMW68431.1 hypothetical protein Poli38472_005899 [Pythium oligandrum]
MFSAGGFGGVQHSNPFGTPVQASPVNPFQGGRGNASGGSNGVHTSFGGERELHIRVDELSLFEKNFPGQPGMERELIVKRFQRSSADHKLDIPSEVRPPGVLRSTQLYLEQNIMDREKIGEDPRFNPPRLPEMIELYNFCWDRCRMIRKDFVLQNYRGAGGRVHPIVLDVHERIARYHILSEHELCEVPSFVAQQNMEQLGQTLKSLNELYDESRKIGDLAYLSPFEAEFRAYFILCTLDNGRGLDVLKFVKGLTPQIREAPQVKFAMKAFVARHTQDYYQFFYLLREATYLQSCLLFRYIPSMRSQALERMNRAYRKQPYPLEDLVDQLCFDDLDHAESVCTHHGLDIGQDENDGAILVNFGGDFETDIDLRKNKNPLPIRSSHVYVGQKQADCWRKDICRGVTEYTPEEYPALSKLVEDTEDLERARLYPDRPPYEDEYSMFSVYTADPYDSNRQAGDQNGNRTPASIRHPEGEPTDQRHDLDDIAKRKAELEHTKQMMLQRLQQLEREKEAKTLQVQQKALESQREAELEARAKAKAEEDALERQREQEAAALREQLLAEQREKQLAEEKRRKEEAKIVAEKAKADEQRRIAEQLRQAEEERVRREAALRAEEARRIAAEAAERRRQEELAAAEAKRKREAALEAQRQAQLARELELKKRAQRIQKQKLAILKLKFHQWRAYVAKSKEALAGVKVGTTQIISGNSARPQNVVEWLFGGRRAAADRIGLRRRQWLSTDTSSRWISSRQWDPLNVVDIVEPSLFRANRASTGWKLLIADLLDEGISSFGSWSALKLGVSGASFDEDDRASTVHYVQLSDSSIPLCLRYLDASFTHSLSRLGQQKKLAGTSSILLPVDLSHVSTPGIFQRWEERVDSVFRNLHASSRVSLMVLAFCSADLHNKLMALTTVEEAIRKLQTRYAAHVNFVDGELVLEDDLGSADVVEAKVTNILVRLADHSTKSKTMCVTIGFADLLEIAVQNAFKRSMGGNVAEIQKQLHQQLSSLQDSLTSPEVLNVDIPIPELQDMVKLPAYGWNSSEAQAKRTRVLVAAMTLQLATDSTELRNDRVCEMYFHKIVEFIDKLFAVTRGSKSHISSDELKRNIYGLLLPIHEQVVAGDGGSVHERIPWQRILEKVFGAFVEEVDNMALYVPKDLPVFQEHNQEEPKHVQTSTTQGKKALDPNAVAAALAFARSALKRTSTRHELDPEQKVGLKKLRQSIAQDRAAAQQFQYFLRRELHR